MIYISLIIIDVEYLLIFFFHVHVGHLYVLFGEMSKYLGPLLIFIYLFMVFFWGGAYGGSQAWSPIRAVATGLHHSHISEGSEPRL